MPDRAIVHPTVAALRPAFLDDGRPRDRLARAMSLMDGTHPAMAAFADAARAATRGGRDACGMGVRAAARLDGASIAQSQQFFGCFNPSRRRDLAAWQFDVLRDARVDGAVAAHVDGTLDLVDPGGERRVGTWVFPADHANAHGMLRLHGLEAWGDLPDGVAVQVWPTPGTLDRLGPVVTRAAALGARSAAAWPADGAATLADHLAREGLAACAVAVRFPDLPDPWAAPFAPASDWDDALAAVALAAGLDRYADVRVNVYGVVAPAGRDRLPVPAAPDADEAAYARVVLGADLRTTDPARIAAYLYGDAVVATNGHPPVGMSPFAGIAAAHALVGDAIARRDLSLSDAFRVPSRDLLDGAFG